MGVGGVIREVLTAKRPTVLFAAPYSGHEWSGFGTMHNELGGENLECMLTSDLQQLAVAVRPFRALHHLREAKILNVASRPLRADYTQAIAGKFGSEIKAIDQPRMLAAYEAIEPKAAEDEARRWIRGAVKVVEPPRSEIVNSCRLALAFEQLMAEEDANCITVDCYGSMYRKLPAFPCVGFVRLNDMGLAGICESHLTSAMTFLVDLGRNDIGRIARFGSVRVGELMTVERYSHVMHLVSHVEGKLKPGLTNLDVLRATFPAGTLSGAPKVRAMEIIDELAPVKRGIYGGAAGYLSFAGDMDLAIVIRTAIIKDNVLYAQAAAGIVADSVPESEWKDKTEVKARAELRAAEQVEDGFDAE